MARARADKPEKKSSKKPKAKKPAGKSTMKPSGKPKATEPKTIAKTEAPVETPKNKGGRPSVYTPEIADEICARLAEGEALISICRDDHMPAQGTVWKWDKDDLNGFSVKYAHARALQIQRREEELLEIADDARNDWMERHDKDGNAVGWVVNGEHVQRSKVRIETRQWILQRLRPEKWGNKVQTEVTGKDGGPLKVENTNLGDIAMARRVAFALGRALERQRTAKAAVIEATTDEIG